MPPPLPIHRDDHGVITLTLAQEERPVVVLDHELLRSLSAALDEVAASGPEGFVLASRGRVFVAGANLEEIMRLSDPELHEYLRFGQAAFAKISALPCTSVAAIHGAVLGGGLELAMHCDVLIGSAPQGAPGSVARPYPVGLPEAGLNICPGWGGTNMLPARIDPEKAVELTAMGRTFTCHEAHQWGLFAELVPDPVSLLARARELARRPRAAGRGPEPIHISNTGDKARVRSAVGSMRVTVTYCQAAEAVFGCVLAGLDGGWRAGLDAERENLVRLRSTPEGRASIRAFFERSKKT